MYTTPYTFAQKNVYHEVYFRILTPTGGGCYYTDKRENTEKTTVYNQ